MTDLGHLGIFDRVYTYARVSSIEQAETRKTIEGQRNRLLATRPKPDKHFEDAMSGDDGTRPDYLALIEQVKTDAIAGQRVLVVITEQSRLSRQGGDRVTELIQMFDDLNVCLYALDGGKLTVKEPHDWLAQNQQAAFNKYFLLQLRRNLRNSKRQKRAEGKPINPSPPFGYKWGREKYEPEPSEWAIARELVELYLPHPEGQGASLRAVAALACSRGAKFSHSGIRQWLMNPVLQGHLYYSVGGHTREEQKRKIRPGTKPREYHYNAHEPLITEHEATAIANRLKENKTYARTGTERNRLPLSGLVICANCDRSMSIKSTSYSKGQKRYDSYLCINKLSCDRRPSISVFKIEAELHRAIAVRAEQLSVLTVESQKQPKTSPEELDLRRNIRELQALYERSPVAGIRMAIAELEEKLQRLQQKPEVKSDSEKIQMYTQIAQDQGFFNSLPDSQKRFCYHLLVSRIEVAKGGQIHIQLSF